MNTILRLILCGSVLAIPGSLKAGGYYHGQRFTHDGSGRAYVGGYYTYNARTYKFDWYAYPKGATYNNDSHAQTFTFNITNNQPHAIRGNTVYGVHDSAYTYGQPFDANRAFHLAGELQQFTAKAAADGYSQLTTFGYQAHQNQLDLEKERTQALKIQALAQLAESTRSQPSSSYVRQQVNTAVQNIGGAIANDAAFLSGYARCMECHADGQKSDGIILPQYGQLDATWREKIFERLMTLDEQRNMALKAQLTDAEHRALVQAFR